MRRQIEATDMKRPAVARCSLERKPCRTAPLFLFFHSCFCWRGTSCEARTLLYCFPPALVRVICSVGRQTRFRLNDHIQCVCYCCSVVLTLFSSTSDWLVGWFRFVYLLFSVPCLYLRVRKVHKNGIIFVVFFFLIWLQTEEKNNGSLWADDGPVRDEHRLAAAVRRERCQPWHLRVPPTATWQQID